MKRLFLLLALVGMIATSCEESGIDEPSNPIEQPGGATYSINGSVQKGPFVLGSSITIQPLDDKLNPTGQVFNTVTNDDAGHFNLGSVMPSKYAEIMASGYYFDEVVGALSQGTLTLRAIADLEDGVANVNLLTTLVMQRTVNLVSNKDISISEAAKQAEQELFISLGIPKDEIPDVRFSRMDISQAGDHNALLLAISVALQHQRTTAELTELISKLAADLADDGVIKKDMVKSLYICSSVDELASTVQNNLFSRYNSLGVENDVPELDKYMSYFLDINGNGIADKIESALLTETYAELDPYEQRFELPFLYVDMANCDITLGDESAESWLSITKSDHGVTVSVAHNLTNESRSTDIIIKDKKTESSALYTVCQRRSYTIEFDYDVASDSDISIVCDIEPFHTSTINGNGGFYFIDAPTAIYSCVGDIITITIPSSITYIECRAFASCSSLKEFKGENVSADGCCITLNGVLLAAVPVITECTTPDDVTVIGDYAFFNCTNLTNVTIGDSVTMIGEHAFGGCTSLTNVAIGDVTTIRGYAFSDCTSLTNVTIGWVGEIYNYAFANCTNIELFTFEGWPPAFGEEVFAGIDILRISVPVDAIKEYCLYCDLSGARFIVAELEDINNVPEALSHLCLFYTTTDNKKLECHSADGEMVWAHSYKQGQGMIVFKENHLPDDSPIPLEYKFAGCSNLESVVLPRFNEINASAFEGCSNLREVTGVVISKVGKAAFSGCSSLSSIDFVGYGDCVDIEDEAFMNCTSLTTIDLCDGHSIWSAKIGRSAFQGCTSLSNLTLPEKDGVWIGEAAFYGCCSLTSVNLTSTESIGTKAFANCSNLIEVYSRWGSMKAKYDGYSSWSAFDGNASGRMIYVRADLVKALKAANGWSDYADAIVGYDFENGVVEE